jgi:exonuclease SbcC
MSDPESISFSGGFDLLKLELYRFMNYQQPTEFSFNSPTIVISGPTGSGKTTILDALTFVLFGRSSRLDLSMVRTEDICGLNGKVKCIFNSGSNNYQVIRGRNSKGKSYLELFINQERINGKIPELNEKIRSTILRMNYRGFVNSTIIRQDEMKSLGSKSSSERLRTLQNLFRLDIFEKAAKDTQEQIKIVNEKKFKLEGELKVKVENLNKIKELEKRIEELKNNLTGNRRKLNLLYTKRKDEEEKSKIHKEQYEKLQIVQSKKSSAQKRLSKIEEKKKKADKELKIFTDAKQRVSTLEKELESFKGLKEEITSLEIIERENTYIQNRIARLKEQKEKDESILQQDLQRKIELLTQTRKRMSNLETDIDHATAFQILNREGRLLERIERISLEQTWKLPLKLIENLKQEQEQARNSLLDVLDKKAGINIDSFKLTEIQNRINELSEEIKVLESRYQKLKQSTDRVLTEEQKKLDELGFSDEMQRQLQELKRKVKVDQQVQEEYQTKKKELETKVDPTSQINSLNVELLEIEEEIIQHKSELKDFRKLQADYETLRKKIELKTEEIQQIKVENARTEQDIKNTKKNIKELKELKPEVKKIQQELEELNREENILSKLKDDIFHVRGAPFYAINKILPRLGKRASLILAEITDQRFTNIQLKRVKRRRQGLGFEINIRTPQGLRDIATFSGGERTQINAALRLAISEELTVLGGENPTETAVKKTLFIDEGDLGSLDTISAQQAFVKKLFNLSHKFKIILITHITEIASQFPNSIQITINEAGRSVKT